MFLCVPDRSYLLMKSKMSITEILDSRVEDKLTEKCLQEDKMKLHNYTRYEQIQPL